MTDTISDPENSDVTPDAEEPQTEVDLVAEAGEAAANQEADQGRKVRSLDELDLEGEVLRQVESYVSKAVNEAVSKHDQRHQERLDEEGFMNRSEVENLLAQKETEYTAREEAKERFLSVLTAEGIPTGSDEFKEVKSFYRKSVEDSVVTPHILLTEAGIRTLISMAGVGKTARAASGPGKGLERSRPNPDGSVAHVDGTVQLNAKAPDAGLTLDERMRNAVSEAVSDL